MTAMHDPFGSLGVPGPRRHEDQRPAADPWETGERIFGTQWDTGEEFDHEMFPPKSFYGRYEERAVRKYPQMGDISARSALTIHRGTRQTSQKARPVLVLGIDGPWLDVDVLSIDRSEFRPWDMEKSLGLDREFDLALCLDQLLTDAARGMAYFKVYRQFKMYNDPDLNPYLYRPGRRQ